MWVSADKSEKDRRKCYPLNSESMLSKVKDELSHICTTNLWTCVGQNMTAGKTVKIITRRKFMEEVKKKRSNLVMPTHYQELTSGAVAVGVKA